MRTFRCIVLTDLGFLLRQAQIGKKNNFWDNLRAINQERSIYIYRTGRLLIQTWLGGWQGFGIHFRYKTPGDLLG